MPADLWVTPEEWRAEWKDAPEGAKATRLLTAAQEQCLAYAPALPEGAEVPESWRLAVLYQARDLAQAPQSGVMMPAEGYAVRVASLSNVVKALLRPKRGRPRVG